MYIAIHIQLGLPPTTFARVRHYLFCAAIQGINTFSFLPPPDWILYKYSRICRNKSSYPSVPASKGSFFLLHALDTCIWLKACVTVYYPAFVPSLITPVKAFPKKGIILHQIPRSVFSLPH